MSELITNAQAESLSLVVNYMASRLEALSRRFDPDRRRNVGNECGWPDCPTAEDFQALYDRHPIAARVVEMMVKESWKVWPTVYEKESSKATTPFELALEGLAKQLGGGSHHRDEVGGAIWRAVKRADALSGIGTYGILLLGIDDGRQLSQPAEGVVEYNTVSLPKGETAPVVNERYKLTTNAKGRKLLYLEAYPECQAEITKWENNRTSPRFGRPTMYSVATGGGSGGNEDVHWSRVVHIPSDGAEAVSGRVYGVERCRPVLNNLLDLRKEYGGSGEGYWQSAVPFFSFEAHPDIRPEQINVEFLKAQFENIRNGFERAAAFGGGTLKSLAPLIPDPTPHILVQIQAICIKMGVPMRKFMGSERGELASGQDDTDQNERVAERQNGHITPSMLVPLTDTLILVGVLPVPPTGFSVFWPDMASQSKGEKATVALTITQAMAAYIASGVEAIMPPLEFLTLVVGMTDAEARSVLEAATGAMDDTGSGGAGT